MPPELGSEHGHTSGIVPAKETSSFFGEPLLYKKSHFIKKMIIEFSCGDEQVIIKSNVMYFYSKTHKHIHITGGGLMPTYKKYGAKAGDVLLFWRSASDYTLYKVILIKQESDEWEKIKNLIRAKGGFIKEKLDINTEVKDADKLEDIYQRESVVDPELNDSDFPAIKKPILKKYEIDRFPVNKAKGDYVLKKYCYKCAINKNHPTFISKTGSPYMEKHHLIPLEFFEEFENSLDDINNIVSLCPLCHRMLHFGDKKTVFPVLEKLLSEKKEDLKKSGISIEIERLKQMY